MCSFVLVCKCTCTVIRHKPLAEKCNMWRRIVHRGYGVNIVQRTSSVAEPWFIKRFFKLIHAQRRSTRRASHKQPRSLSVDFHIHCASISASTGRMQAVLGAMRTLLFNAARKMRVVVLANDFLNKIWNRRSTELRASRSWSRSPRRPGPPASFGQR